MNIDENWYIFLINYNYPVLKHRHSLGWNGDYQHSLGACNCGAEPPDEVLTAFKLYKLKL